MNHTFKSISIKDAEMIANEKFIREYLTFHDFNEAIREIVDNSKGQGSVKVDFIVETLELGDVYSGTLFVHEDYYRKDENKDVRNRMIEHAKMGCELSKIEALIKDAEETVSIFNEWKNLP